MAKVKYYYDEETLSYRKVDGNKKGRLKRSITIFVAIVLIAFLGFLGFGQIISTPKERKQNRELENLKIQYDLLSKRVDEGIKVLQELQQRDNYIYRMYFEANSSLESKNELTDIDKYKYLQEYDNKELVAKIAQDVSFLSEKIVAQSKSYDEIVGLIKQKEKMLASIPAIKPVKNDGIVRTSSGFGMRMHPILKTMRLHKGMDFTAPTGTPIYATGNGVVKHATRSTTYGNVVYLDHGYGYSTVYAHMSKIKVKKNQRVKRGDVIGLIGNTGQSAAPHLHYEVRKNDKPINPIYYFYGDLTPEEFSAIQKASEQMSQSLD